MRLGTTCARDVCYTLTVCSINTFLTFLLLMHDLLLLVFALLFLVTDHIEPQPTAIKPADGRTSMEENTSRCVWAAEDARDTTHTHSDVTFSYSVREGSLLLLPIQQWNHASNVTINLRQEVGRFPVHDKPSVGLQWYKTTASSDMTGGVDTCGGRGWTWERMKTVEVDCGSIWLPKLRSNAFMHMNVNMSFVIK